MLTCTHAKGAVLRTLRLLTNTKAHASTPIKTKLAIKGAQHDSKSANVPPQHRIIKKGAASILAHKLYSGSVSKNAHESAWVGMRAATDTLSMLAIHFRNGTYRFISHSKRRENISMPAVANAESANERDRAQVVSHTRKTIMQIHSA